MCTLVLKFKKCREIITGKKSVKIWDPLLDELIPELFDDLQSDM
jgi:hypothetical protein